MTHDASARGALPSRNLLLLNYALLFASIFFAGVPGLIAVVIAYVQREGAPALIRRHYDFQIRIFWVAFAMSLLAALCILTIVIEALAGLMADSQVMAFLGENILRLDLTSLTIERRTLALAFGAVALMILNSLWLAAASLAGFLRLASAPMIGHSPPP